MNSVIQLAPGIDKITEGSLYPHQSDGVAFLLSKKRAILADDMGLVVDYSGRNEPTNIEPNQIERATVEENEYPAKLESISNQNSQSEFQEYLKRASEADAHAQRVVGYLYQIGDGVRPDLIKARDWYLAAAEQGNLDAIWLLSQFHSDGTSGEINLDRARYWADQARRRQTKQRAPCRRSMIAVTNPEYRLGGV